MSSYLSLIFVDPGVKVNGSYYRDVLLSQKLLPVMREVSIEFFIFQQDRARDTVRFLEQTMPAFISPDLWPPNSPDLNPVDCKIWGIVQQRVYQSRVHDVDQLKQRLLNVWHGIEQCCWQHNYWWVARTTSSLCAGKRGAFWTNSVTTSVTRWMGNVSNCVKLKYKDILL